MSYRCVLSICFAQDSTRTESGEGMGDPCGQLPLTVIMHLPSRLLLFTVCDFLLWLVIATGTLNPPRRPDQSISYQVPYLPKHEEVCSGRLIVDTGGVDLCLRSWYVASVI